MTETKTSKPGGSAAQFLSALHMQQADLWHEGLDALDEPERTALNQRCLKACEGGYLTVDVDLGVFVITAKGRAYVDGAAAPKPAAKPTKFAPVDLSALPNGMYAVPGGDSRLKLRVEHGEGKWAGFVFVKDGAVYGEGKRYGMQKPGQSYRGQVQDALRVIVADPMAASAAYGKLTETCGVCGAHLENEESVAFGIGPVCRKKFAA